MIESLLHPLPMMALSNWLDILLVSYCCFTRRGPESDCFFSQWTFPAGHPVATIREHKRPVTSVAFNPGKGLEHFMITYVSFYDQSLQKSYLFTKPHLHYV